MFLLGSSACGPDDDDNGDGDVGVDVETDVPVDPECPFEDHTAAVDWTLVETVAGLDGGDVTVESMGAFLSVWGPCSNDVYVVGGQPDDGRMVHFDGTDWAEVELPDGPLLNWVYGFEDGSVWTVGNGGLALYSADGSTFTATETGLDVPLWGVWGSGPDDVWAVGGDVLDRDATEPVMIHWDGTAWSPADLPELDRDSKAFFKVWGTGPDHVFAVGQRGVIVHYDGESWTQLSTGIADDVISLWGIADDNIAAVGGRSNGVFGRWDGSAWTFETLTGVPGINGIWMSPTGESSLAGNNGVALRIAPGGSDYVDDDVDTREVLHGMWGHPGGPRISVGGSLDRSPPWTGVIYIDP